MQRFPQPLATVSVATRDISKNPSKALRDAAAQPVVITKYGQPIACLVSMEHWYDLMRQVQDLAIDERMAGTEVGACLDPLLPPQS